MLPQSLRTLVCLAISARCEGWRSGVERDVSGVGLACLQTRGVRKCPGWTTSPESNTTSALRPGEADTSDRSLMAMRTLG